MAKMTPEKKKQVEDVTQSFAVAIAEEMESHLVNHWCHLAHHFDSATHDDLTELQLEKAEREIFKRAVNILKKRIEDKQL